MPQKLIAPLSIFMISNHLASDIKVKENETFAEFDPRSFGLMSEKVQKLLSGIKHPQEGSD